MSDFNIFNLKKIISFNKKYIERIFTKKEREVISEYIKIYGTKVENTRLLIYNGLDNCNNNSGIQYDDKYMIYIPIFFSEKRQMSLHFCTDEFIISNNLDYKKLYAHNNKYLSNFDSFIDFNINSGYYKYNKYVKYKKFNCYLNNEDIFNVYIFQYNNDIVILIDINYDESLYSDEMVLNIAFKDIYNYFKNIFDTSLKIENKILIKENYIYDEINRFNFKNLYTLPLYLNKILIIKLYFFIK